MKDINVEVSKLLEVLKNNREKHVKEYNEAMVGYRQAVVKELKKTLAKAKKNEDISYAIYTPRPQSYEDNYDFMISKLEATTDTVVSLSDTEFQQYYLDKWSWKNSFETTTKLYNK